METTLSWFKKSNEKFMNSFINGVSYAAPLGYKTTHVMIIYYIAIHWLVVSSSGKVIDKRMNVHWCYTFNFPLPIPITIQSMIDNPPSCPNFQGPTDVSTIIFTHERLISDLFKK